MLMHEALEIQKRQLAMIENSGHKDLMIGSIIDALRYTVNLMQRLEKMGKPMEWNDLINIREETPLVYEARGGDIFWRILMVTPAQAEKLCEPGNEEHRRYNLDYRYWTRMPTEDERRTAAWNERTLENAPPTELN